MFLILSCIVGFTVSILGIVLYVHTLSRLKGMYGALGYSVILSVVIGCTFMEGVLFIILSTALYFFLSCGIEVTEGKVEEFINDK